jgi:hypothetical protein
VMQHSNSFTDAPNVGITGSIIEFVVGERIERR